MSKVKLRSIWKIFGPSPEYTFKSMDRGASQSEIMAQTWHVVAVRDVSLDIAQSEIFVVMGLSGSGKSTPVAFGDLILVGAVEVDPLIIAYDASGAIQWQFIPEN